jgi:hypothetical protein
LRAARSREVRREKPVASATPSLAVGDIWLPIAPCHVEVGKDERSFWIDREDPDRLLRRGIVSSAIGLLRKMCLVAFAGG